MSMLQRTVEVFALCMAAGVLLLRDCPDDVSEKALLFWFLLWWGSCSVHGCPLSLLFLKQQNEFWAVFKNKQVKHWQTLCNPGELEKFRLWCGDGPYYPECKISGQKLKSDEPRDKHGIDLWWESCLSSFAASCIGVISWTFFLRFSFPLHSLQCIH